MGGMERGAAEVEDVGAAPTASSACCARLKRSYSVIYDGAFFGLHAHKSAYGEM